MIGNKESCEQETLNQPIATATSSYLCSLCRPITHCKLCRGRLYLRKTTKSQVHAAIGYADSPVCVSSSAAVGHSAELGLPGRWLARCCFTAAMIISLLSPRLTITHKCMLVNVKLFVLVFAYVNLANNNKHTSALLLWPQSNQYN